VTTALVAALIGCEQGGSTSVQTAPQFVDLAGLQAEIAAHRGRPLLLNFWATWCPPCVAEMPDLAEVAKEFRGAGLTVVGVSYDFMVPGPTRDEALQSVAAFQRQESIPFPLLVFEGKDYQEINAALRLPGPVPVTLAFDAEGREVARLESGADLAGLRLLARKALDGH